jgi:hypothetical protein
MSSAVTFTTLSGEQATATAAKSVSCIVHVVCCAFCYAAEVRLLGEQQSCALQHAQL